MSQETTPVRNGDADRMRKHPTERFDPAQQLIDLRAAAADLAAEATTAVPRHRQKTLIRYGHTTVALFHFTAGSSMPEHLAKGTITIHVLEGRMTVRAGDQTYDLPAGQILVLAPGVKHDLHAPEESRMLLTVHLEGDR
jgi:quercetin dioxygenase-like cupin family protein